MQRLSFSLTSGQVQYLWERVYPRMGRNGCRWFRRFWSQPNFRYDTAPFLIPQSGDFP